MTTPQDSQIPYVPGHTEQQPTTPPPAPPGADTRRGLLIALAVALALVTLGGVTALAVKLSDEPRYAAVALVKPTPTAPPAAYCPYGTLANGTCVGDAATSPPAGPMKFAVGEPAGWSDTNGSKGTVTVTAARASGKYLLITVTVTCDVGTTSYNPFDWSYLSGSGVPHEHGFAVDVKGQLHSGDIGAGQKVTGVVVFDGVEADLHGGQVQYSPGFKTIAYWVIP